MKQETPIANAIQSIVAADGLAGAVRLIWRAGQVIQVDCIGWRNLETRLPMERDTLFRIASMTKPITSLAALMLWEKGRFALSNPISRWAPEFTAMRVLHSPTAPLEQTVVDDYLAFARLFVESGMVDGVRFLRPETLAMMTANCLSRGQRAKSEMMGMPLFATGHGFGLGVAVVMEPEQANPLICGGGIGSVGWPGAYGGWWQADPSDCSVLIFLTHNMVRLDQLANGIGFGAWDAITQFQALAASSR